MHFVYYYDRIRIYSSIPADGLRELIDIRELREHTTKIEIGDSHGWMQMRGYPGRIELNQATDKAIKLLQKYDFDNHSVTRIEIARDLICNNRMSAQRYCSAFQNCHYFKWGKGSFKIGNTMYMGKEEGIKRGIYLSCYIPEKVKLGNKTVVHSEFVILRWINVSKKLGIDSLYDIENAQYYYNLLKEKYIVQAEVNSRRLEKHFPNTTIRCIPDVIDFIKHKKESLRDKNYKHYIFNAFIGSELREKFGRKIDFEYSSKERTLLNQGIGYWLKVV